MSDLIAFGPLRMTDRAFGLQVATVDGLIALWREQGRPGTMLDFAAEFTGLVYDTVGHMDDNGEFVKRTVRHRRRREAA